MHDLALAALLILAGAFSFLGASLNWHFFMNDPKAQRLVRAFGHNGARAIYAALGVVLLTTGLVVGVNAPVPQQHEEAPPEAPAGLGCRDPQESFASQHNSRSV